MHWNKVLPVSLRQIKSGVTVAYWCYRKVMSELKAFLGAAQEFTVRATPKASRDRIVIEGDDIRVYVTTVPENGKANAAIIKLLSKALGVPKSGITLVRGETSRDKTFRLD